jgi:hypothetical protein
MLLCPISLCAADVEDASLRYCTLLKDVVSGSCLKLDWEAQGQHNASALQSMSHCSIAMHCSNQVQGVELQLMDCLMWTEGSSEVSICHIGATCESPTALRTLAVCSGGADMLTD